MQHAMGNGSPALSSDIDRKPLPDRIRRELRKGETIYHSANPCHVSKKHPEGKWVAHLRREERGRLVKYPVRAFGTPAEALGYLKTLRPDTKGRVYAPAAGESTVCDLFEYVFPGTASGTFVMAPLPQTHILGPEYGD